MFTSCECLVYLSHWLTADVNVMLDIAVNAGHELRLQIKHRRLFDDAAALCIHACALPMYCTRCSVHHKPSGTC